MTTEQGFATRAGRRTRNEDAALVVPESGLFAVSDGMGGLDAGDVASRIATDTFRDAARDIAALRAAIAREDRPEVKLALSDLMSDLAQRANEAIWEHSLERRGRMGATLTAAVIAGSALFVGHTGDSRAYLVRGGRSFQLTSDTTVAAVRLRAGKISAEQYASSPYRNALADALGITPAVKLAFQEVGLLTGDAVVLCTDGVWEVLDGETIAAVAADPPEAAARTLVDAAFAAGSSDNLTAVVVHFQDDRRRVDPAATLGAIPLFSDFEQAELRRLAPFLRERRYAAGQAVVREGEAGHELLVLMEGALEVSKRGVLLTRLQPPQVFGEIALARAGPRTATVTALEPARVLAMHRDQLNDLIQRQPGLGAQLVVHLLRQLAEWLVELTDRVVEPE